MYSVVGKEGSAPGLQALGKIQEEAALRGGLDRAGPRRAHAADGVGGGVAEPDEDRREQGTGAAHAAAAVHGEAAVLAGSNRLAVLGDDGEWEVLGFAEAELLAPGLYELSHLLRGMDGSASGAAAAGRRMFVPDSRAVSVPVDGAWLDTTMNLRAFAGRSDVTGQALAVEIGLGPVLPLAPTNLVATRTLPLGDITFTWSRRSRADPNGTGAGVPALEYVPEAYRVTIFNGASPVRSIDVGAASAAYPAALQLLDFGSLPASFTFTVAQMSAGFGAGHPAQGVFHA